MGGAFRIRVGGDPLTDLAVVKVEAWTTVWPVLPIPMNCVGQLAIAIGNPWDNPTRLPQVWSVLSIDLLVDPGENRYLEGMIQTDAATIQGTRWSFDNQGEVIGVTTAIIEQAEGIGFATPPPRPLAIRS